MAGKPSGPEAFVGPILFSSSTISFFLYSADSHVFSICRTPYVKCSQKLGEQSLSISNVVEKKPVNKVGKNEHHLWEKRDSTGSRQKALNLIRIVSQLPNEKETVYRALDKWVAWETEFPLIAAAKALRILKKRSQWLRVIQVMTKWMLSKGQGATMGTYDTFLLAFDIDDRVDEAGSLWNMVLHTHNRSISKWYANHHPECHAKPIMMFLLDTTILFVFVDMEELCVRLDETTVRKVVCAFQELDLEGKQKLFLRRYMGK
ncbi:hypothetical protein ES332_A05G431400v1 [Gossypium tomentosum]|uniref:Pentatricopeptide repeat-containing protein n=1 Tax=Gossypium tomentosum TaxID=34277 RepID=A0A5D2QSJ7_GOSTO|nr:hypothetical protein ES332_A05G431400v1 [Gossypium tomentosum]